MTTPLLIYIAGPYRATTAWRREQNIHRARAWGVVVARAGAYPVIPHANTAHFDGEAPDELWLAGTLALMRKCDGVLLIDGWCYPNGACAECDEAVRLGIPVLDADAEIEDANAIGASDLVSAWLKHSVAARKP